MSISAQGVERVFVESTPLSSINGAEECMDELGLSLHRLYVDLEEGFRLQAIFGSDGQPLIISSPAGFRTIEQSALLVNSQGTTDLCELLTSNLTVGATGKGFVARPLHTEIDARFDVQKISFADLMGTPDTATVVLSLFGLDSQSLVGDVSGLRTENGAWAAFGGMKGADKENIVLIANLLSAAPITYELNLQVSDSEGAVYKHLARRAQDTDTNTHYSLKNTGPDGP